MKTYLKKAVWKCRHCGNEYTTEMQSNDQIKQPAFCECRHKNFEFLINKSEFCEEKEKIESTLFNSKAQNLLNIFIDYVKLAEMFQEQQPFYYSPEKIWWLWNNEKKVWERIDETDLLNCMDAKVAGLFLFKNQIKSEILNALKMQGRKNPPKDMPGTWIQLGQKIYDIKTHLILDATPTYFTTTRIPWTIENGQDTETPNIDELFHDWVPEEYVSLLYEICAYCMLPSYPLRRTFCLNGEGANGKTSFMHIIENLVGKENICSTDFNMLLSNRFEAAKLFRKLVCQMGEISHKELKDTQTFKKLTGGDLIRIEFKGKDCFDAYSFAKLLIATNKLPESPDKTKGYFDRWIIIDFARTFSEKPGLLDIIPNEEYEALARKCLVVLPKLLEKAQFTQEGDSREKALRYEEKASPFNDFLKTYCVSDQKEKAPFWLLYKEYASYCGERGYRIPSKVETSRLLNSRGYFIEKEHLTNEEGKETTRRVVMGLALKLS